MHQKLPWIELVMMEQNMNCIDGWPSAQPISVYFAVDVLLQDGSKAAVTAGNARNKMDGINSEATSSSSSLVILYLVAIKRPFLTVSTFILFSSLARPNERPQPHQEIQPKKKVWHTFSLKYQITVHLRQNQNESFHVENSNQLEIGLRFWFTGHFIVSFAFSDFAI